MVCKNLRRDYKLKKVFESQHTVEIPTEVKEALKKFRVTNRKGNAALSGRSL